MLRRALLMRWFGQLVEMVPRYSVGPTHDEILSLMAKIRQLF
jgi:hypothetical protein